MHKRYFKIMKSILAVFITIVLSFSMMACTKESEAERARREINEAIAEYRKTHDELEYLQNQQKQVQNRIKELEGNG